MTKIDEDIDASAAPLMDHLVELRQRLMRSIIVFFVAFIACFSISGKLFDIITLPYVWAMSWSGNHDDLRLVFTDPFEFFLVKIKIAAFVAILISFPFIATQLYRFIAPGLYKQERMAFVPFLIAAPILFAVGVVVVYLIFAPMVMIFVIGQQQLGGVGSVQIEYLARVGSYLSLIIALMLAFGFVFQLPVVTSILVRVGLLSTQTMVEKRKWAIVLAFVVAAVITPPDVISQFALALPTLLLYEVSIWIGRKIERKRELQQGATDAADEDEEQEKE